MWVERAQLLRSSMQLENLSTEWLLTEGFGLDTATVAQRAACRVIDGLPLGELAGCPEVQALTGCSTLGKDTVFGQPGGMAGQGEGVRRAKSPSPSKTPRSKTFSGHPPDEVLLLGSIRSAKTMISACAAARASQTVDLSMLKAGEIARFSIISVKVSLAEVAFRLVCALFRSRPELEGLIVGEPTKEVLTVRHPSGRNVEIACVAAAKAGASGLSRWCMGTIFDEAARMWGHEEGVVNLDHMVTGLRGRLLPGAQILYITSPWARQGPVYQWVMQYWQTGAVGGPVILRAPGPLLNPIWWTPERCETLRLKDPDCHRTDVLGEFLEPESAWLDDCLTPSQLCCPIGWRPHNPRFHYSAAIDPATRGNAWTLVLVAKTENATEVWGTAEWRGSRDRPLSPRWVFCEIARLLKPYGVNKLLSDPWSQDSMIGYARDAGLVLVTEHWTQDRTVNAMHKLRGSLLEQEVLLPELGELVEDLRNARKRITQDGMALALPTTADGRHCDFVPSLLRALSRTLPVPKPEPIVYGSQAWKEQQDRAEMAWCIERAKLEARYAAAMGRR